MGIEDIMEEQGRSVNTPSSSTTNEPSSSNSGGSTSGTRTVQIEVPMTLQDVGSEQALLYLNLVQTVLLLMLLMQR